MMHPTVGGMKRDWQLQLVGQKSIPLFLNGHPWLGPPLLFPYNYRLSLSFLISFGIQHSNNNLSLAQLYTYISSDSYLSLLMFFPSPGSCLLHPHADGDNQIIFNLYQLPCIFLSIKYICHAHHQSGPFNWWCWITSTIFTLILASPAQKGPPPFIATRAYASHRHRALEGPINSTWTNFLFLEFGMAS